MRSAAQSHFGAQASDGGAHLDPAQDSPDAHWKHGRAELDGGHPTCGAHGGSASVLSWARLTIAADQVDDAERLRISTENRYRALTMDKHGEGTPEAKSLAAQLDALKTVERIAVLELKHAMRAHPLGEWVVSVHGIGEKTAARLLGLIGDPAHRLDPEAGEVTERTVSQLWAYCGYDVRDGKAPKRQHGTQCNWNTEARKRVWLIADCAIKHRESPYRAVYDRERAKWADRDTTDLHKHNHALRVVGKTFLKDLWREARMSATPITAAPAPKSSEVAAV